jgi:hypothetical protein
MLGRLLAFVALASSFIPASFAQQGSITGQGSVQGQGQIIIGPPAIPPTVTISPSTANLATSATQNFTATVINDNFGQGVTWTLAGAGCSGATCGTISQPISKSGVPITYTAPASAPSPNLVVLTATSVLNPIPASSASVNITITTPPPPIVVRNECIPGSQTTATTNTFSCQASLGNAVEVTIYNSPTTTVTGVTAGGIPLTQVCSPTNVCVASSGGTSIQKWYGVGLPSGITTYVVTNTSPTSLMGIAVMDLSNIIALDTAAFCTFPVATTGPICPAVTTTSSDIIIPAIGVTGSTTGIAAPFTNVPGVVFGNGLAYTISATPGTFTPNWVTTSGTGVGATSAYIGGVPTPVISVSVAPTSASVKVNTTATFTATVNNDPQGVNWTLAGNGCSGATCGTLSSSSTASGVAVTYTAPAAVPSPATVTLTAASITNPQKTASATITVTSNPIVVSVSPGTASVQTSATQTFSCTVTNDAATAGCDWTLTGAGCSGATCGGLSVSHTASGVTLTYTGPAAVPSPATVTLTAASTTDNTKTAAATITVFAPPPIVVSVSPGSANVVTSAVKAFSCTVTNDAGAAGCDWALTGAGCSGATCGTLSTTHTASGVTLNYTGPGSVPSPATVTLTATSTTDNTKSAAATITVVAAPVLTVTISPGSASVQTGLTQSFTPTVTNDGSNLGVDWTLTGAGCSGATCGTISLTHTASGTPTVYTAPAVVPSPATVTIKATSTTDNTKSASSTITVFALAIVVSVSPGTASVNVNGTQNFTPTVTNDAANAGVDWSLSGSCTAYSQNFSGSTIPTGWAATTATGVEGGGSFSPSHISFSQGVLQMNVTQDGTTAGSVGAEIEYNQLFGYGTYSWSMQAAGTSATQGGSGSAVSGQISSTFQYSGGNPSPTEIDAPEIEGQFPNQIEYTTWVNGIKSDFDQVTLSNPQNTYHVYKYIWAPGKIQFFIDGTSQFTTTTNVPTAPAHPIANLWGTNSTNFGGLATAGVTRYMYINNFTYSNCGTLSATHTASGTPVTYTAPAIVPSPATVTITATSTTDNTKSASSTITVGPPSNISVAVAPSTASVTTNGVANFTATVTNDTSNLGVTWTLSGAGCSGATCGSVSPVSSASGVAVVYTAPNSVPSPATVTITATSVTAPTKTATATITVVAPVITVTVAPTTATLQVGGQTQSFTATIANSTQGVNWTLTGSTCSGATCGTLSASTSLSGVPITYTSPSSPNVSQTVTLTATSIQDGTKTAAATIHVNANTTQPSCANTPCPAFLGTGVNGNFSAQGGGAATPGGRGGVVYEVTTLADVNGACTATAVGFTNCSYRQAYNSSQGCQPRYVIFRVAGVVPETAGDLRTGCPFMTVEGHSAPGEVILGGPSTTGALGGISTHDIILRYLTMSPDNITQASGPDSGTTSVWIVNCSSITQALSLSTPPPTNSGCYNIMVDHASLRWSGNKSWITTSNFTPTATTAGVGPNHSITTQWTLMYEPNQGHPVGFGTATDETCVSAASAGNCLSSYETDIDFHHDMLINVDHRIPEIGNKSTRWTNNIVYNWGTYAMQELGAMTLDIINNKYIKGNLGPSQPHPAHWSANGPEICGPPSGYMAGNIFGNVGDNTVNADQWGDLAVATNGEAAQNETDPNVALCPQATNTAGIPVPSAWQRTSPMPASNAFPIVPDFATSLDTVVVPYVGNWAHLDGLGNWVSSRDPQDTRITNEYKNGGSGGYYPNDVTYTGVCWTGVTPQCSPATLPLPTVQAPWTDTPVTNFPLQVESLHDGIPDSWKQHYGLSTTDTNLYKTIDTGTGLPYIEDYYDGLVPVTIIASSGSPPNLQQSAGWTQIQGSAMRGGTENVIQCPADNFNGYSYDYPSSCFNVIADPNSAVIDAARYRQLYFGGGHNDYCGNEVYALDLSLVGRAAIGPTQTGPLYRLDPPTACNATSSESNTIGAAPLNIPTTVSPNARHTYNGIVGVPPLDQMLVISGAKWSNGFSSNATWNIPLGNLNSGCAPNCDPLWVQTSATVPNAGVGLVAEYDPGTKLVWEMDGSGTPGLYSLDPTNYAAGWTLRVSQGMDYHMGSVIDPDDEYFVMLGPTTTSICVNPCGVWYFNLTGTLAAHHPTLDTSCTNMITNAINVGTQPIVRPGMAWDPIGRRIVIQLGYGNTIWYMDPKTWMCTSENYGSVQGTDYPPNHVDYSASGIVTPGSDPAINRGFGYFPNLDTFSYCPDAGLDCWYLNLRRGNVAITNTSGGTLTNKPVSIPQPARQGDIPTCPNAFLSQSGLYTAVSTTQGDVKNRWPDGSWKYGVISFVVPGSWLNGQTIFVDYDNQGTCNNTGQLSQAQMLAGGFNFDGQIQLTGTASHNISARTILSGASSISDCTGTDPDGVLASSGVTACYWLKGPVVTAVILEDRHGRTFDVNTDSATGNPLHPRFEAWFYPQDNSVQLGYTLENTWGSTTATSSARDQTFSVVLTGGNTSPATEFTNPSYTMLTRTMWNKVFCINGTNAGSANDCNGTGLHIDHNWRYWAETKVLPHWDPYLTIAPSKIASEWANLFSTGSDPRCGSAPCQPGNAALPLGGCTTCFTSNSTKGGVVYYPWSLGDTGSAEFHGPVPTWDTTYLLSQCDAGNSTSAACGNGGGGDMRNVMLTTAGLGGQVPYWYREADTNAGVGGTFDNSGVIGNVQTQGRIISINAREQVTLRDATTQNFCGSGHTADFINFGGAGQDVGGWGTGNLDMSHWPETAFVSYLSTGEYHFYEQEMMQGAYALAGSPGTTSCVSNPDTFGNHRWAQNGYFGLDQERANDWQTRTTMLAATNAVDGSPEKAYFADKLMRNVAVWEGTKNIPFDVTGAAYLSGDWTYGNTQRGPNNTNAKAGPRGSWTWGPVPGYQDERNFPTCGPSDPSGCTQPGFGNARFQNAYSGFVAAWLDELGYCPHPNGNPCGFLTYVAPFYFNQTLNPQADIHQFDDYEYIIGGGAPDTTSTPITSWTWAGNLANYYQICGPNSGNTAYNIYCAAGQPIKTSVWKNSTIGGGGVCSGTTDENWPVESLAVMSFLYPLTDAASGYRGSDAYNALRQSYVVANGCGTGPVSFATSSAKWDITPRSGLRGPQAYPMPVGLQ